MKIYIIRQLETSDSINFGSDFRPEAFHDLAKAEARIHELRMGLEDWGGFHYDMEELEVV
jgi:hypothetical protein